MGVGDLGAQSLSASIIGKEKDGGRLRVREDKVRKGSSHFNVVHHLGQEQGTQTQTLCLGMLMDQVWGKKPMNLSGKFSILPIRVRPHYITPQAPS